MYTFKEEDRKSMIIEDEAGDIVAEISGFNIDFRVNFEKIKSTSDIDIVSEKFADIFKEQIINVIVNK